MKSWKGAKAIYFVSNLSIVLTIWLFSNIIFHINQRKTLDSILDHFLWRTGISLAQLMQVNWENSANSLQESGISKRKYQSRW